MIIAIYNPSHFPRFYPFSWTQPLFNLRCGIFTPLERLEFLSGQRIKTIVQEHLYPIFGSVFFPDNIVCMVNGSCILSPRLWLAIQTLKHGERLIDSKNKRTIAAMASTSTSLPIFYKEDLMAAFFEQFEAKIYESDEEVLFLESVTDLFQINGALIRSDFKHLTAGRSKGILADSHSVVYNEEQIFIEEGVKIRATIFDAEKGPIYVGKGAEIQPGAILTGPLAICENATIHIGAKIKGDTTIGPYCKVGGEVSNSVLMGYSNKGHDGFIGNTVIGYWCNLGADTNTSNLKNNYSNVRIYDAEQTQMVDTGLQFCGLLMGDHCRSGINTMFNTGTVVGPWSNVFGAGFPDKFIPPFTWGGVDRKLVHDPQRAYMASQRMMERRKLSPHDGLRTYMNALLSSTRELRSGFQVSDGVGE